MVLNHKLTLENASPGPQGEAGRENTLAAQKYQNNLFYVEEKAERRCGERVHLRLPKPYETSLCATGHRVRQHISLSG